MFAGSQAAESRRDAISVLVDVPGFHPGSSAWNPVGFWFSVVRRSPDFIKFNPFGICGTAGFCRVLVLGTFHPINQLGTNH